ncbi:chlorophyllase/cutinase-like alpha/beta fold protein [Microvirga makkahensis]|uniref:Alpha/beta hydrolase fold domain-containing protein n=1 Tax=Microvirga makkahensis TaxID=1128670 RepID=A0A7X3MN17_9HYPH|nr:alpha/beta hydrolase fold domain-containing protein [Microvirga makkahensis]MXQ09997.1 alpha/beta hydrolase fold domain-containing protein [Microvirga makkahensis]
MRRSLIAFVFLGSCLAAPLGFAATPPKQPEQGPGGSDYKIAEVVKRGTGTVSSGAYIFHGDDTPAARPVAVFFHSWGAVNPALYGGFINHLARRGYLVIFPRFQDVNRSRPADASVRAEVLIFNALTALADDPQARPDPTRVVFVGHSAGVPIALNVAANIEQNQLPAPRLIFGLVPGGVASTEKERGIVLRDLSTVDRQTLLITMNGDREHLPGDRASRRIFEATSAVPATRKLFMRASSDDHGYPPLTATLAFPGSPRAEYDAAAIKLLPEPPRDPKQKNTWRWSADMALTGPQTILTQQLGNNATDTLDYLAVWKTFEMAAEAAFAGKDATALARNPKFLDMGSWSDGWPVRRLSAQMPKVEGQEEKPERGPRRRLNMNPAADSKEGLAQLPGRRP